MESVAENEGHGCRDAREEDIMLTQKLCECGCGSIVSPGSIFKRGHNMRKPVKQNIVNNVIQGDAIIEMEKLPEKSVDIIITSPPYNLNIKYSTHKDNMDQEKYLNWLGGVFDAAHRVLKDDGSLFLNVGASNKDPWVYMDVANVLRTDYNLQNDIVWIKSVAIDNTTYGHFKPINSKRFLNHTYEHIFHFTKKCDVEIDKKAIGVPYMDKSNITRWKHTENADKRCKGNCWFIPYDTIQSKSEKGHHPATFPEKLARDCIMMHGYDSNTMVLDMFAGTGSTLAAAKELGTQYIGIDIDDAYVEYANNRLNQ